MKKEIQNESYHDKKSDTQGIADEHRAEVESGFWLKRSTAMSATTIHLTEFHHILQWILENITLTASRAFTV